jgi:kinetochore protein Mis12/MTW1
LGIRQWYVWDLPENPFTANSPQSLIDDIINSINILAERALNSVEQGLLNAPPATLGFKNPKNAPQTLPDPAERAKNEIESGTHQLETLLCASIDRNFDVFEIYVLRNIFCVKPVELRNYIRLGHYEGLEFSGVSTSAANGSQEREQEANGASANLAPGDKPTLESINQLRRRLRESMRLNALLHAEQERNARLLADLRDLVGAGATGADKVKHEESGSAGATTATGEGADAERQLQQEQLDAQQRPTGPLAFLQQRAAPLKDAGAATPLSTTTKFTMSQLQALRALSTSLQTMAPHLTPAQTDDDADDDAEGADAGRTGTKSWRRERLEYIEGATRRHLETVHGLELGKDGEVRDGEWQGEGRRLARGEVEGLENVVSMLGGGSEGEGEAGGTSGSRDGSGDETMEES